MPTHDIALLVSLELLRDSLSQLLVLRGHRVVHTACHRDELFAGLDASLPQVVVVDLDLRDSTDNAPDPALAAVKSLAAWYPQVHPLLLATHPTGALIDLAYQAGAHGLIDKAEAKFAHLLQAVETVASGSRFFPLESLAPRAPLEQAPLRHGSLTHRELEVLRYIAAGADNLNIASHLQVSERTIRAHVSALYRKLAAQNRVTLALHAGRLGLKAPAQ